MLLQSDDGILMKTLKHGITCENCACDFDFVFKALSADELKKIARHKHTRTYQKGEILFYEGMEPFGVYCIATGAVKLYKTDQNGSQTILRIVKKGSLLELRALLARQNNSSTGEVLEDGEICFIDKKTIVSMIEKNQNLFSDVTKNLCAQLGDYENKIHSLAKDSVRERLARLLLDLAKNFTKKKKNKNIIEINLSREEMAQLIGTATETLIRFLSEFKRDRLVAINGRKIEILDEKSISDIAGNLPII